MDGDERGFRVALVAAELVNPAPGAIDALAILDAEGWGVVQLPAAWYDDEVATPLLEQVAEMADEFLRHGYDVVLLGEHRGLEPALAALGHALPPALPAPGDAAALQAFLASRPAVARR